MTNIEKSIKFYYNLYNKNMKAILDIIDIKKIKLSSLTINDNFLKKNPLDIDIYVHSKKQLYYLLVIKDDDKYILLDTFNQFLDIKSFNDEEVSCIVIEKEKIKMKFDNKITIYGNSYFDKSINLKVTDMCNKYFILYPFKEMINKQYRVYNVSINDYINLIEAIANLPEIINQRIFISKKVNEKC